MKKTFFLLLLSLSAFAQNVVRVTANTSLQAAIENAASGTVFIVEGGVHIENLDIDKRVTLIGTGYFLNGNNQATQTVSEVSHIRFKPGSEGSLITGFKAASVNISANNIIVKRNYFTEPIRLGYTGLGTEGYWSGTANNCHILQNYAQRLEVIARGGNNSTVHNFTVKGNIFYRYGFHLEGRISGAIINNTFNLSGGNESFCSYDFYSTGCYFGCGVLNVAFNNNILPKISPTQHNYCGSWADKSVCPINEYPTSNFSGNVFTEDYQNLIFNNIINIEFNTLFLGNPNDLSINIPPDARAQLAAGSPARGAGVGGTDAGAFGGDMPYVLSGIPEIPHVYQLDVQPSTTSGSTLQVQIKAKTNN
jgi:hypothetical protein